MPTDTATLTTRDGCALTYQDTGGEGIPLVMLHGWSQSQAMYDRLLPQLPADQRVITYDMRNHGISGRTDNGARVSALAGDLDQLLAHLDIDRAHLLGHSMGVSVIWSYLELFGPERVRSLVLVDQPTACTVLPWLETSEAAQFGAILDYKGAADFAQAMLSRDSDAARLDFLTSMLTEDIPRRTWSGSTSRTSSSPCPGEHASCWTTSCRTGGTCSRGSPCRPWSSAVRSATSHPPRRHGPPTVSRTPNCASWTVARAGPTSPSTNPRDFAGILQDFISRT